MNPKIFLEIVCKRSLNVCMAQSKAELNAEAKPPRGRRPKITMPDSTMFAPSLPTNGADLLGLWELDRSAWSEGRVKLARREYASNQVALVGEFSVEHYDLGAAAANYGPGEYLLTLSPDPLRRWKAHNCKVIVTPAYAIEHGYQAAPAAPAAQAPAPVAQLPTVRDITSLQRAADAIASERPITMRDLGDLMETITTRAVAAALQAHPQPAPAAQGMEGIMALWNMLNTVQERAETRILGMVERAQGRPAMEAEGGGSEWAPVIREALPAIQTMFSNLIPRQPAAPAAPAEPAPSMEAPAVQVEVPLTSNEIAGLSGAAAMLRPFVGMFLLPLIARNPDDGMIAGELVDYIPEPLVPQLLNLAELTANRGEKCLGIIDSRLATPRGAAIVAKLAEMLKDERRTEDER